MTSYSNGVWTDYESHSTPTGDLYARPTAVSSRTFDVRDADHPVARMSVPGSMLHLPRSARRQQRGRRPASDMPARAIMDDMDGVAEPITELGSCTTPGSANAVCRGTGPP